MSSSYDLKITYNINNIDKEIEIDPTQKVSVLKYKICKEEGVPSETLDFYYKDNLITVDDDRVVMEIFAIDKNPKLVIMPSGQSKIVFYYILI